MNSDSPAAVLTTDQVRRIIAELCERQFPRDCSNCEVRFESLADFLRATTSVGDPVSYDSALDDWRPVDPIGTASYYQCACETTLCVSSDGMPNETMWQLLQWARAEHLSTGVSLRERLGVLRRQIDDYMCSAGLMIRSIPCPCPCPCPPSVRSGPGRARARARARARSGTGIGQGAVQPVRLRTVGHVPPEASALGPQRQRVHHGSAEQERCVIPAEHIYVLAQAATVREAG